MVNDTQKSCRWSTLTTVSMDLLPDTKIARFARVGNAGNVFPATDFKENR